MKNQRKAYIYALLSVLLWSTVATAFKISLNYVSFLQLLFYAAGVALLCFTLIIYTQKKGKLLFFISYKQLLYTAFTGFLNPFLYYVVLLKAYSILPAQIAQPLNYLWPSVLVLLSVPLLGQKLKIKSVLSLLIGFIGVYVISTQGNIFSFNTENPFGIFLAAGSSVIWALSWIFNQKNKQDEAVKLFWSFFFGFIYISITILLFSEFKIPETKGIFALIYVGLFEIGITFFFWMKALQYTKSNDKISNLIFISPFLALIFINLILDENIYYTTFIGLVFIVAGIFIGQIKRKKVKKITNQIKK